MRDFSGVWDSGEEMESDCERELLFVIKNASAVACFAAGACASLPRGLPRVLNPGHACALLRSLLEAESDVRCKDMFRLDKNSSIDDMRN